MSTWEAFAEGYRMGKQKEAEEETFEIESKRTREINGIDKPLDENHKSK